MNQYTRYENGIPVENWIIEGSYVPPAADGWVDTTGQDISIPPPVPDSVTPAQARMALLARSGAETGKTMLDDVNAACAAAGGNILIYWNYASRIDRNSPMVAHMASVLNLSSLQLDALFLAASQV